MCCTCSAAISTRPSRWRSSERRRQMASWGRKEARSSPTECKYCNHWQSATSLLRPGTCLTWRELYQTDFYPPRLQNLKQRDPVDPGRFHGYGPNAASEQPGRQRLEVFRKSLEATNRVRIPVRRDRYVDFGGSYIDPGCIRLDTFQTGNCSTSAGAFVSHRLLSSATERAKSWGQVISQTGSTPCSGRRHQSFDHATWDHARKRAPEKAPKCRTACFPPRGGNHCIATIATCSFLFQPAPAGPLLRMTTITLPTQTPEDNCFGRPILLDILLSFRIVLGAGQ